jgi:iron complex transport system substrate-binding protein
MPIRLRLLLVSLLLCPLLSPCSAKAAAPYPVTVTDMAGRQVTITQPPQRIALQDGRIVLDLALLDRTNPFARVVVWNNMLSRADKPFWAVMSGKWPQAKTIPDMGFNDNGAVNLEEIVAEKPQLLIAELRARPALEQAGVMRVLASLNIPVLFIDDAVNPVPGAARSVTLLGQVLNRPSEARAYTEFYNAHLASMDAVIHAVPQPHPTVFVEALAGQNDADACCFTHGNFGWGLLVQDVGAANLGSKLLDSPSGTVSMETLLALQPDVFIVTDHSPGSATSPGFGYGANPAQLASSFRALQARTGFSTLNAARQDHVYGIYHAFYTSPYNIVGLEYLAKFIYPKPFASLDPAQTYHTLITSFTDIPPAPVILGQQAPAFGH